MQIGGSWQQQQYMYPHRPVEVLRASRVYRRLQDLSRELWKEAKGGAGLKRCALCPKSMDANCFSTAQATKPAAKRRCKYCAEAEERLDEDLRREEEGYEEEDYEQGNP